MKKRLYKSRTDRKVFGVCGGVAKYFDIDPTIVRVIWAALILLKGIGLGIYIVCALVFPDEPEIIIDDDPITTSNYWDDK